MSIAGPTSGDGVEGRSKSFGTFLSGLRHLVAAGLRSLFWIGLITWSALVIYYSNLPWAGLRMASAAAFAAFAVWAIWLSRRRHMPSVVVALLHRGGGVVDRHPALA